MPSIEARIPTDRPGRYLQQFCTHAAAMGDGHGRPHADLPHRTASRTVSTQAEFSDTRGVVTFAPSGSCTLTAEAGLLVVRIDADDADTLRAIRRLVSDDFARFGRRDGLEVVWRDCA
jgi:hypothetical protein